MVKYGAAAALAAATRPVVAAAAPSTVSGVVYENRSGGAQRAAGVVKTDAAGRYALPADEESIVRDKGERE